ncbi:hypothetical protein, partial [Micromonospora echinofusca]|uniref:hypothetical protein n=1 Tax=Micromonospora echinofusca TaxID=47858 RepID=UPI001AD62929
MRPVLAPVLGLAVAASLGLLANGAGAVGPMIPEPQPLLNPPPVLETVSPQPATPTPGVVSPQ